MIKAPWPVAAGKLRHSRRDSVVNESCGGDSSEVDANRVIS